MQYRGNKNKSTNEWVNEGKGLNTIHTKRKKEERNDAKQIRKCPRGITLSVRSRPYFYRILDLRRNPVK